MANYPTPHIDAKPGDFGQTVLMPGDRCAQSSLRKTSCRTRSWSTMSAAFRATPESTTAQRSPSWHPAWACRRSASIRGSFTPCSAWRISCASAPPARCRTRSSCATSSSVRAPAPTPTGRRSTIWQARLPRLQTSTCWRPASRLAKEMGVAVPRRQHPVLRPVLRRRRRYARGLAGKLRLAEDGRSCRGDGSGGALYERGAGKEACACHLHGLGPYPSS